MTDRMPNSITDALYTGNIRHRRFEPVQHEFNYEITMVLLDLDRVEQSLGPWPLLSSRVPAIGWFRRKDHFGIPSEPLKETVLNRIENVLGFRPGGKIMLLTNLRYWGFMMNPLGIYYCYDENGDLSAVALQVTNTPWREKTLYALAVDSSKKNQHRVFEKEMHVSPFNPMEMDYHCMFRAPKESLFFHLENHFKNDKHTDATMTFTRQDGSRLRLLGLVFSFPAVTLKVGFGIYWQALKLWLKKSPFYGHPDSLEPSKNLKINHQQVLK